MAALVATLVVLAPAAPAAVAAGPAGTDLPRGPGLSDAPRATAPLPRTTGPAARSQAGGARTTAATRVNARGGFVDGCDDSTGPDIRRTFVVVDLSGDAELSVMLCDGDDPAGIAGSYAWVTVAGDSELNYRRIDVQSDGAGGFDVSATFADQDGNSLVAPVPGANPRWELDTSGPAPRLVALVDADALGIGSDCQPSDPIPCLGLTLTAFAGDGTAVDGLPDDHDGTPDISDRHSLFWPSPCGFSTGASTPTTRGDSRAVLSTTGEVTALVATLREAGYPVRAHGTTVAVDAGVDDATLRALSELDGVTAARRPAVRTQAVTPRDPQYGGGTRQWYLPRVRAPEAWNLTTGSSSVRIGIVDDGIDGSRSDFAGRVAAGYDAVNEVGIPAGRNSDLGAHGTAVAAMAGATGSTASSATGMAGMDWRAQLVPIRIWSHDRCFDELAYLRGLEWARGADLDVINLSLGGPDPIDDDGNRSGEASLLRQLTSAGTVVVAASGNNSWHDAPQSYPAALPLVVAVGATGPDDRLASYSNTGRYIDLVAPGGAGGSLASGVLTATDPTVHGGEFGIENGTSFSAPLVTGAVGLYRATHPTATVAETVRALIGTARDLDAESAGFDQQYGYGLLDVAALLSAPSSVTTTVRRLAGRDRFETAALAAQRAFPAPGNVQTVVIATGENFPDALAGGPFARQLHAPILLTRRSGLPPATVAELRRLDPRDVVLLGGPNTISSTVASQLASLGYPTGAGCASALADGLRSSCRLAGSDRYETAAAIVGQGWSSARVAYVATGTSFPDALSGGATAAAFDAPLLLTAPTALPAATRSQLARLAPDVVIVLGGSRTIASSVSTAIANTPGVGEVVRAAGGDRYETAAIALCPHELACFRDSRIVTVATGAGFPDALAGSAAAAALGAPLLLANPANPNDVSFVSAVDVLEPEQAIVLGGYGTLPRGVETTLRSHVVR